MLESLRISFRKDYCAARPQSGFGNPLAWRRFLLTFIFLFLCFSQTSFAEIPSSATEYGGTRSVSALARRNPLRTFAEKILMCLQRNT